MHYQVVGHMTPYLEIAVGHIYDMQATEYMQHAYVLCIQFKLETLFKSNYFNFLCLGKSRCAHIFSIIFRSMPCGTRNAHFANRILLFFVQHNSTGIIETVSFCIFIQGNCSFCAHCLLRVPAGRLVDRSVGTSIVSEHDIHIK